MSMLIAHKSKRVEQLIKAAGGITDRGFIAILEKTITTHAVLLGVLYEHQHTSLHDNNDMFLDAKGKVISSI